MHAPAMIVQSLDDALQPPAPAPGFAAPAGEIARSVPLEPWYIDRCRHAYLGVPADSEGGRLVGITSTANDEGKTGIAVGMATAMAADMQAATVLIECDLEKPSFGDFFAGSQGLGLSNWLDDAQTQLRIMRAAPLSNLFVIPAGTAGGNSARLFYQLIDSGLVNALRARFLNIVIDLPPMLSIAYSSLGSKLADRIILVVRHGHTPMADIEKTVFLLGRERLTGIVVNGADYRTPSWLRRVL